jgi:Ser/Thr protein kinase RdoA (MazF antagonist)
VTDAAAATAAAAWGGAGRLRLVAARENAVYAADLRAGPAALRLHRPGYQTEAAIRSELWWCAALADAGVPVPRPLPTTDGALLHRLPDGRIATAVAWAAGAPIGAAGRPMEGPPARIVALHATLGRLLGDLHRATDALAPPPWFERPRWDVPGLVGEAPFWSRFWEHPALTGREADLLRQARAALMPDLAGDFGLIHADVLRENVLAAPAGLTLIDFDDSGWGFRGYDLGTVLSQCLAEPALPDIAAALAEGYAAGRPAFPVAAATLPHWTLMRCCASVGWTMTRLAPGDPIHRSHIARATALARRVLDGRGFG